MKYMEGRGQLLGGVSHSDAPKNQIFVENISPFFCSDFEVSGSSLEARVEDILDLHCGLHIGEEAAVKVEIYDSNGPIAADIAF